MTIVYSDWLWLSSVSVQGLSLHLSDPSNWRLNFACSACKANALPLVHKMLTAAVMGLSEKYVQDCSLHLVSSHMDLNNPAASPLQFILGMTGCPDVWETHLEPAWAGSSKPMCHHLALPYSDYLLSSSGQ